jgi:hypothetical protein
LSGDELAAVAKKAESLGLMLGPQQMSNYYGMALKLPEY